MSAASGRDDAAGRSLASASVSASTPAFAAAPAAPAQLNGFVENLGQWPADVLFHARAGATEATLLRDALVFRARTADAASAPIVLALPDDGARAVAGVDALAPLHHFATAAGSASGARGFRTVRYRGIAPGVDLQVRSDGAAFHYDLLVEPGARLDDFALRLDGVDALELAAPDRLVMRTRDGAVEQAIGDVWQVDAAGRREALACRFRLLADADGAPRFGFELEGRDPLLAVVVDPSLKWQTYLGGTADDQLPRIAVAPDGSTYVAYAASCCAPVTPGAFDTTHAGALDLWVGKLSPDGALLWGTYVGGGQTESSNQLAIAAAADGTLVIAGVTFSADFPTTPGALQPAFTGAPGSSELYVARLRADGTGLVWSTFLGTPDSDHLTYGEPLTLLSNGDVVCGGVTRGFLSPTPGAFDPTPTYHPAGPFAQEASFLFRLSADGSSLVFLTYLDGAAPEALATAPGDEVVLVAGADAGGFESLTPGAYKSTVSGLTDVYVAVFDAGGTTLHCGTYVGGAAAEIPTDVAVDAASAIYVSLRMAGSGFPTTPGAFDPTGVDHGAVFKLLPRGSGLVWSTHLESCCGGVGYPASIQVDRAGNAVVAGSANEPGYPTTPDALHPTFLGTAFKGDATLTKLDALGESLAYSTFLGGTAVDYMTDLALSQAGDAHVVYQTWSTDVLLTPGAHQTSIAGGADLAVLRLELGLLPWEVLGGGLSGALDVPNLAGTGALTAGAPTRFALRGAAPSSSGWLVIGFARVDVPFLGGTLVPFPKVVLPITTNALGTAEVVAPWPIAPSGLQGFAQAWIADPGAPQGWSASNGIGWTTP